MAAFFSFGLGETMSLYSFRLERWVCFFAKHLSLTTFTDQLRFFALNLWVEGFLFMSLHLRLRQCMHASVGLCVSQIKRIYYTGQNDWQERQIYWCIKHHALCDWSSIRQNKSLTATIRDKVNRIIGFLVHCAFKVFSHFALPWTT